MPTGNEASRDIPSRVIVLGRGMLADGELTPASHQRAVAARRFYDEWSPELVIFSGGGSYLSDNYGTQAVSEARAMSNIAGLPEGVTVLEEESTHTLGNFMLSSSLIPSDEAVGVIAHRAHMPRALYFGRKILTAKVVPIEAESYGAEPEQGNDRLEKLVLFAERIAFAGIKPGELDRLIARTAKLDKIKKCLTPAIKKLVGRRDQYR